MDLPILRDKYQERYIGFPSQRVWGSSIIPLKREVLILVLIRCLTYINISPSALSPHNCPTKDEMSEYPLCTLLVEEGRAATPGRGRCKINPVYGFIHSGFILWPLSGSSKDLNRLYRHTS